MPKWSSQNVPSGPPRPRRFAPRPGLLAPRPGLLAPRRLAVAAIAIAAALLPALPASAQWIPCPAQQDLVTIPVLAAPDSPDPGNPQPQILRGTLLLSDQQQRLTFRQPPAKKPGETGATTRCAPQYVRVFRGIGAVPPPPPPASDSHYADPLPGPTLRARVGDLVQLTFLNQINPSNFGNSIDRGDQATGTGCDESSNGYPAKVPTGGDTFPNCFHGSSTANIHFHGTHTNPGSTGDNVFIEVRPSTRVDGKPVVTEESVRKSFDEFFAHCKAELLPDPLRQWPRTWSDLPGSYTAKQEELIRKYDETPGIKKLWPVNEAQLKEGAWPQYYIGAYPYCFRLPEYTATAWPPPAPAPAAGHAAAHAGGEGSAELAGAEPARALMMGQAPGTHWYHAHKHGSTAIDVSNGMTGAFIIEGKYDDELNKYYGDGWTRKQPLMVINQIGVTPNLERGGAGRTDAGESFSVNGRLDPLVHMKPGEVQMWRIVNTSFRSGAYFLAPQNGFQWRQLAQDGVQLADVNYQGSLNKPFLLAAGNRADLLVKAPTSPGAGCKDHGSCAYPFQVIVDVDPSDLTSLNPVTLLSVKVSSGSAPEMKFMPAAPSFPPFLADIKREEVKGTKKIVFATSGGPSTGAIHTIDGQKFSGQVGEVVLLNTVEEWKVINETYGPLISHPFHIHINPFQVVEVFSPNDPLLDASGKPVQKTDPATGKLVNESKYTFSKNPLPGQCRLDRNHPDDWKPCDAPARQQDLVWWDVFPIPSGAQLPDPDDSSKTIKVPGYFKLRSRFVDYTGYYVIHCHILAHEDRGMMTIVEVAPLRSPYSHH
ncbi:MAG TPA: multicopper oxidase domain-containing protein [Thermoanaerobaculia bacterium]